MAALNLTGRVVWITGAGRGIGRAAALALAECGARVALSARTRSEIDKTATGIRVRGGAALALVCDVRRSDRVIAAHEALCKEWGAVDVLINNAGTAVFKPIVDTGDDDWAAMIDTNLSGAFYCSRAVLPGMIARRSGHIINVVSVAGRQPYRSCGAYCAGKYGLLGFTDVLRLEARRHNVQVTALLPGATDTALWGDAGVDRRLMIDPAAVARAIVGLLDAGDNAMIEELVIRPQNGDLP